VTERCAVVAGDEVMTEPDDESPSFAVVVCGAWAPYAITPTRIAASDALDAATMRRARAAACGRRRRGGVGACQGVIVSCLPRSQATGAKPLL
jgi:hypothetical protein